jgi:hypothetical protein
MNKRHNMRPLGPEMLEQRVVLSGAVPPMGPWIPPGLAHSAMVGSFTASGRHQDRSPTHQAFNLAQHSGHGAPPPGAATLTFLSAMQGVFNNSLASVPKGSG